MLNSTLPLFPNPEFEPLFTVNQFLEFTDRLLEPLGMNVPAIVEIELLRSLSSGTFGRAWADFIDQNNLTVFTTGIRRKQLHDGVHILTGYGSDSIGEAEVQAFLLGAKFSPFNMVILVGLLRMSRRKLGQQQFCQQLASIRQRLRTAYQRGHQAQFDPDT